MSFDWREYFALAQELSGQAGVTSAGTEARLRSALSRAYYAAFCQARNHLRDREGERLPEAQVHTYVRDRFRDSADAARQQIGHHLNRLRIDRNKADYNDMVPGLDKMVVLDMEMAQQVLIQLSRL